MNNFSLGGDDDDDDQEILEPYITQDITKDVISCSTALFRLILHRKILPPDNEQGSGGPAGS